MAANNPPAAIDDLNLNLIDKNCKTHKTSFLKNLLWRSSKVSVRATFISLGVGPIGKYLGQYC